MGGDEFVQSLFQTYSTNYEKNSHFTSCCLPPVRYFCYILTQTSQNFKLSHSFRVKMRGVRCFCIARR